MERYFIGLIVPRRLDNELNLWRRKFDPGQIKRHPPHLTLKPPFNLEDPEALSQSLEDVVPFFQDLKMIIKRLDQFPGHRRQHLTIELSQELLSLHEKITKLTKIPPLYRPFVPHLTLGILNQRQMEKARQEFVGRSFFADSLVLFKWVNDRWEVFWEGSLHKDVDRKVGDDRPSQDGR